MLHTKDANERQAAFGKLLGMSTAERDKIDATLDRVEKLSESMDIDISDVLQLLSTLDDGEAVTTKEMQAQRGIEALATWATQPRRERDDYPFDLDKE